MVGADVVTVGTIIGALIGTVTFLLRTLVAAKNCAHRDAREDASRRDRRAQPVPGSDADGSL